MMRRQITIGILGAGWVVEHVHVPLLLEFEGLQHIWLWDPDVMASQRVRERDPLRISVADTCEGILGQALALLIVATPNHSHAHYVQLGLALQHNVLCEKPLCVSLDELHAIKRTAGHSRGHLDVSYPNRERPEIQRLGEVLRSGRLGQIYRVHALWSRHRGIPAAPWFLERRSSGGGVLQDIGSHLCDVLLWLTGYPEPVAFAGQGSSHFLCQPSHHAAWQSRVWSCSDMAASDVEDNVAAYVEFSSMAWLIELGWASYRSNDATEFHVYGSQGYARLKTLFGLSPDTADPNAYLDIRTADDESREVFAPEHRLEPFRRMLRRVVDRAVGKSEVRDPRLLNAALAPTRVTAGLYEAMSHQGGGTFPAETAIHEPASREVT